MPNNKNDERVLVFPAHLLNSLPLIVDGWHPDPHMFANVIFNSNQLQYMRRGDVEENPDYKQIIPYAGVRHEQSVLVYQRTKKGGEDRLHNLYSLGVGGHIQDSDGATPFEAFIRGMTREFIEEVQVDCAVEHTQVKGVIYDDTNPVGRVHFGFFFLFQASSNEVKILDDAISEAHFRPIAEVKMMRSLFENWSQIVIDHLGDLL